MSYPHPLYPHLMHMDDDEADAILERYAKGKATDKDLERVIDESYCGSARSQGSDWCRACAARDILRKKGHRDV